MFGLRLLAADELASPGAGYVGCSKNSPINLSVDPYTSSAAQALTSGMEDDRMASRTIGRLSTQYSWAACDMRAALSSRCKRPTILLAAGWYVHVRMRSQPRNSHSLKKSVDSNWGGAVSCTRLWCAKLSNPVLQEVEGDGLGVTADQRDGFTPSS